MAGVFIADAVFTGDEKRQGIGEFAMREVLGERGEKLLRAKALRRRPSPKNGPRRPLGKRSAGLFRSGWKFG